MLIQTSQSCAGKFNMRLNQKQGFVMSAFVLYQKLMKKNINNIGKFCIFDAARSFGEL